MNVRYWNFIDRLHNKLVIQMVVILIRCRGRVGSFACFGVAVECAASKCANARRQDGLILSIATF